MTECGNYRGISFVAHADEVPFKTQRLLRGEGAAAGGAMRLLRSHRSTTNMMFAVRRLQKLGKIARVPLFLCFIYLQKACDSVDRTLLWQVLARCEIPPQMIEVIRQFHVGMRACVRGNDGVR